MRNLNEVTEAELKTAYDNTPAFNQYVPWEEVQANPIYSTILKNQIIAHEQEQYMEKQPKPSRIFLAVDNKNAPPVFTGVDLSTGADKTVTLSVATDQKPAKRRSTITLHEKQIEKIKSAVILGRNCLRSGHVNDLLRSEALSDLAEAQKILQSFYEPRV
jgi:hypothetical protein